MGTRVALKQLGSSVPTCLQRALLKEMLMYHMLLLCLLLASNSKAWSFQKAINIFSSLFVYCVQLSWFTSPCIPSLFTFIQRPNFFGKKFFYKSILRRIIIFVVWCYRRLHFKMCHCLPPALFLTNIVAYNSPSIHFLNHLSNSGSRHGWSRSWLQQDYTVDR